MPTVCGDGMSDVWPISGLEDDYQAHSTVNSPLRIKLYENGPGDFTAHIVAEEDVTGARLCMVATHDDYVAAYGGATSHLEYHAVHMMTASSGDAFALAAGESVDVHRTFSIQPEWDYESMGVACWVQAPGGTNTSPNPYGDVPVKNHVLQSAFIETGATGVHEGQGHETAAVRLMPPSPNPFPGTASLSFVLPERGDVALGIYDITGRQVAEVVSGTVGEGEHNVAWDGRDEHGRECASGIYFARLLFRGTEAARQKLVRLR